MNAIKEWPKATKIVTKVQYHWFQRELLSVEKGYGTGIYTAEEIRALLRATDYVALPEGQGAAKLCGCMRCGLTFIGTNHKYHVDCPNRTPKPRRVWAAPVWDWIMVNPAVDHYETRPLVA
jgi:hypothetical protein